MDVELTIRPEQPADFEAIDVLVAAAFGSPEEAKLVRNIRASDRYWAHASLVAVIDEVVVGHVMISSAELRSAEGAVDVAMLSPLAVAAEHRRQGIADALVRAACAIVDDRGEPMVLLQGDPAYYGRFGFVPSADHGITMQLPDWAPPEAAQVLRLSAWTGELRGALIEPPAFDGLD